MSGDFDLEASALRCDACGNIQNLCLTPGPPPQRRLCRTCGERLFGRRYWEAVKQRIRCEGCRRNQPLYRTLAGDLCRRCIVERDL